MDTYWNTPFISSSGCSDFERREENVISDVRLYYYFPLSAIPEFTKDNDHTLELKNEDAEG